jgi:DmsE family decaheme c-type cytochrome
MRALLGLLLLAPVLLRSADSRSSDASRAGYVGSAVCRTCHPDIWLNFYKNPHYKSLAAGTEPPEKTGCESCHGPAKAHVEARGGKSTIVAFSQLEPRQVLDRCLACHSKDLSRGQIRRSSHTLAEVACSGCHSIHRSPAPQQLLARKQPELCYDCHPQIQAQFSMPFKHRVNEGFMRCTDCHNPHGTQAAAWRMSQRPRMVETGTQGEQPCLKCHADKRGPFVFEHPAVRVDGCETCHQPHGSPHARLLRRPAVFTLCLECHNGAGGFGRQRDGIPRPSSAHNLADARYRNCTTCHVRIHGSNADPLMLR